MSTTQNVSLSQTVSTHKKHPENDCLYLLSYAARFSPGLFCLCCQAIQVLSAPVNSYPVAIGSQDGNKTSRNLSPLPMYVLNSNYPGKHFRATSKTKYSYDDF